MRSIAVPARGARRARGEWRVGYRDRSAVSIASQTIRNITGVDVLSSNASVENGEISLYKVQVKIAFVVDASSVGSG